MEILMLRLDIFEELHSSLYDFWQRILPCYSRSMQAGVVDAGLFSDVFTFNVDISKRLDSNLHTLCQSLTDQDGTLEQMELNQLDILDVFGIPHSPHSPHNEEVIKEFYKLALDEKGEKHKQEYYDIEESKQLVKHETEKIEIIISKEMKKFWNHIDILIINSYKQLLYDITGSDDFVEAFMKGLLKYGIMKDLAEAKRNRDYDRIIDISGVIDECIGDWVRDIEHLVGAEG